MLTDTESGQNHPPKQQNRLPRREFFRLIGRGAKTATKVGLVVGLSHIEIHEEQVATEGGSLINGVR